MYLCFCLRVMILILLIMYDSDVSMGSEDVIQFFEVVLIYVVIKDVVMLEVVIEDVVKLMMKDVVVNLRSEERFDVVFVFVVGLDVVGIYECEEVVFVLYFEFGVFVVEYIYKVQFYDRNKGKVFVDFDFDIDIDIDDDDIDDERFEV